jgi:hypothetical protein
MRKNRTKIKKLKRENRDPWDWQGICDDPTAWLKDFCMRRGHRQNDNRANSILHFSIGWKNSAMHSIVSRNEKSRVDE